MSNEAKQSGESPGSVNPLALTLPDLARLLSAVGERAVTVAMLEADLAAGAPVNPDGTVNMVNYAAWLASKTD